MTNLQIFNWFKSNDKQKLEEFFNNFTINMLDAFGKQDLFFWTIQIVAASLPPVITVSNEVSYQKMLLDRITEFY